MGEFDLLGLGDILQKKQKLRQMQIDLAVEERARADVRKPLKLTANDVFGVRDSIENRSRPGWKNLKDLHDYRGEWTRGSDGFLYDTWGNRYGGFIGEEGIADLKQFKLPADVKEFDMKEKTGTTHRYQAVRAEPVEEEEESVEESTERYQAEVREQSDAAARAVAARQNAERVEGTKKILASLGAPKSVIDAEGTASEGDET